MPNRFPLRWYYQNGLTKLDGPNRGARARNAAPRERLGRPETSAANGIRKAMPAHHEAIANSLTRDILSGRYRAGDRLPSERELASRFDVHRGAVREAVKSLQQLGIVDVQPGGARVASVEEASFDVIGKLLEMNDLPDPNLVGQVLQVLNALFKLAAETAIEHATDAELDNIVRRVGRLRHAVLEASQGRREEDIVARFELMRAVMEVSGNLATRLVARGLVVQIARRLGGLVASYQTQDPDAYANLLSGLEDALRRRCREALRKSMDALSVANQDTIQRALALAAQAQPQEAAAR